MTDFESSISMPLPQLSREQIHVWTVSLAASAEVLDHASAILSEDERGRADRLITAVLWRRFVMARARLRQVLGAYAKIAPACVSFEYGKHGKPRLVGEDGISFNLSHAGDVAMVAVARHREVGVDIEAASGKLNFIEIAEQAFSRAECAALAALSGGLLCDAFYRIWVRKEAYIKARGDGFSYPTTIFSVTHLEGDDDAMVSDEHDCHSDFDWRVSELCAPDGFHAAVAASDCDWNVLAIDGAM